MKRLALFDCDGTLVDSQANICLAMEQSFANAGLPLPDRIATRRVVGLSLVETVRALHPDGHPDLHVAMAEDYKNAFQMLRRQGQIAEPLFDGIRPLLATLADADWLLGVATGKSQRGLNLCLAHHGIGDCFVTLQTADHHPSKPHPAMALQAMAEASTLPEQTIVIGDTSYDMEMAKAAGTKAIGVLWGYHDHGDLIRAGADLIAAHPDELLEMLETLS